MTTDDDTPRIATELAPTHAFDVACRMVLGYLATSSPMGTWAVTRVTAGLQTMLVTAGDAYGLAPGVRGPWSSTMCHTMVSGETPRVVPDTSAVPGLAGALGAAAAQDIAVGAYVGTPIVRQDGELFGTIIGIDPEPIPVERLVPESLLDLLTSLLSSVLDADATATEAARALENARTEAETDQLTGLLNRRGWERWMAREEDRFRRFGDTASVVMFDLDRLKAVNDTAGHDAGDRHLRRAADALRHAVRAGDPVARLGGDEFVMVVSLDVEDTTSMVRRLHEVLDAAGTPCSIGVAPFTVTDGFPGACALADQAMYENKRERRRSAVAPAAAVVEPTTPPTPYTT